MGNFFGNIDDSAFQSMHFTGSGWLGAFFIVGAMIVFGRLFMNWQMKKIERASREAADHDASGVNK